MGCENPSTCCSRSASTACSNGIRFWPRADVVDSAFRRYNLALGAGLSKVAGKLFRFGHLGDLNDLMVLGALAGAEMAMRDVGIDIAMGSGVAAAQAHFRKTIMAKEKPPTEEERFAETHPEGVVHA